MRKPKSEEFIEQVLKHRGVLDVGGGETVEYWLGSQKIQNHTRRERVLRGFYERE